MNRPDLSVPGGRDGILVAGERVKARLKGLLSIQSLQSSREPFVRDQHYNPSTSTAWAPPSKRIVNDTM